MRTRGRPRHDDVLTPRQWEVLELLREGRSNREIGEVLDISVDGAKFHVAEILGRLGVGSRREAAAVEIAPLSGAGTVPSGEAPDLCVSDTDPAPEAAAGAPAGGPPGGDVPVSRWRLGGEQARLEMAGRAPRRAGGRRSGANASPHMRKLAA